jgi:hypothetical protein
MGVSRSKAAFGLRAVRTLLIVHVAVLVLVRLFRDSDDFSDWDLIAFLNANSFDSLWQLLQRPEIHFRQLFAFSMNVGAESVPSTILFRGLGHVSLYWSNVILVLVAGHEKGGGGYQCMQHV